MKTLRLTADESRAYAAGERCFWRAMRKQPRTGPCTGLPHVHGVWMPKGWNLLHPIGEEAAIKECTYGTHGDRIRLAVANPPFSDAVIEHDIAAITPTERDGKWGWLVEVGA